MGSKNKLPTMLNKEHIVRLFDTVYIPKVAIAMFVSLMCGLRIGEVLRLEINDIDLVNRKLFIRNSKNPNRSKEGYGKDRIVPIPKIAIHPIEQWVSIINGQTKWFLPSNKSVEIHTCKEYLHGGFYEARKRAGLDSIEYNITYKKNKLNKIGRKQFHFKWHSLRHFYATYVYEKTRDLYVVANLLGHNQITTTQIYAKISDKIKKETIDFAFDTPIMIKVFEKNPINALNYSISTIAKEKPNENKPIEILEERFAKGEISASDFQTAMRLLKVKEDYFDKREEVKEVKEISGK